MRATKKKQAKKTIAGQIFVISRSEIVFFRNVFFISRIFFGNRQQSNARAGQKKTMFFFDNARPKSNARAHLEQRKNHSGLRAI